MTYHRTFNKVTRRVPLQSRNCWPFRRTDVHPCFRLWDSCFSICSLLCSVLLIIVFSPFLFSIVLYGLQFTKEQVCLRLPFLCGLTNNGFIGIFHGRYVPWGVIVLFQSQHNNFASSCPKYFSSWLAIQIIIFYVKGKGHLPMNFDIVTFSMKTVMTLVGEDTGLHYVFSVREDNFVKIKGSVSLPTFGMHYDWSILEVKYLHDMART